MRRFASAAFAALLLGLILLGVACLIAFIVRAAAS